MPTTELREEIKIGGGDAAARTLSRVAGAADHLAKQLGGVLSVAGAVGGIAGLWQVGETVRETDQLYAAVTRVKAVTGASAEHAHAMFDWFELSGVEMENAEAIMTALARQTGKLGAGFAGSADAAQNLQNILTKIGVSVKAGPEDRLLQMAAAAQKGKLQVNDLITAFNIPRRQAGQVMDMLLQGPARLREMQRQTLSDGDLITEQALEQYRSMVQARRELGDAWGGLVGTLYKNALPAATFIVKSIRDGLEAIQPIAAGIGKILTDHMTTVVTLTKTYLGLLLASKAINRFSGEKNQLGVYDRLKQLGGMGLDFLTPQKIGRKFSPGGGVQKIFSVAGMGGFMEGSAIVKILSSTIGRLGVLSGIVGVIAAGVLAIVNNTDGIRTRLMSSLKGIFDSLMRIVAALSPIISKLAELVGGVLSTAANAILWVVDKVLMAVEGIAKLVAWIIEHLPKFNVVEQMAAKAGIKLPGDAPAAAAAAADKVPKAGNGTVINQDFRGSKFEIQNNFPPDIDGGRVAVATADELAALGERRLDSGLRPLYSYR